MAYTCVFPAENGDTWSAFEGLFPDDLDHKNTDNLLLGAADEKGNALGGMMVDVSSESYTINWLYVAPEARKMGVGNFLVDTLIDFMEKSATFREVEIFYMENQEDIKGFVENRDDFFVLEDCLAYTVTEADFENSKSMHKLVKCKSNAISWASADYKQQREFLGMLEDEDYYKVIEPKAWEETLDKDLSFCMVHNDRITGCILIQKLSDTDLELSYLYCERDVEVSDLFAASFGQLIRHYKKFNLHITAASDFSEKAVRGYFGKDITGIRRCIATLE